MVLTSGAGGSEVELAAVGGEGVVESLAVGLGCPVGEEAALDSLEGGRGAAAAGEGCRRPTGSEGDGSSGASLAHPPPLHSMAAGAFEFDHHHHHIL